ncbi:MAG: S8 family serine peptidase [Bacteroidales bacterium]|nr:S8 family serine peptidase [Bacteroidales bacterium]
MKNLGKIILATALAACTFSNQSFAQYKVYPGKYAVKFTDKNNSPYSLERPNEFLTQKSLDRRAKFGIKLNDSDLPVNPQYVDSLKSLGFKIQGTSKWLNCAVVICDSTDVEKLKNLSFVDYDYVWRQKIENAPKNREEIKRPKISKKSLDKTIKLDYGNGLNQAQMLNIQVLHNLGYKGEGMVAAIFDAGFYKVPEWESFQQMIKDGHILGTRDFANFGTEVYNADNHGMNVLSCITGNKPGKLIGTAPETQVYLFRTEISSSENIIEEFLWAFAAEVSDSLGVDLIHSSLGYYKFDDTDKSYKYSEMDGNTAISSIAADCAVSKGIFVTISAGNEGNDPWHYITSPADADSVLSVGAVDKDRNLAYFSSRGPSYDNRVKPDVCAKGLSAAVQGTSNHITQASGTSFAGPIMAGACICLLQAHPKAPIMTVMKAVKAAGSQYDHPDNDYGYGIPDFEIAHKILIKEGY